MSGRGKFGPRFMKPKAESGPTRYLYVSGLHGDFQNRVSEIKNIFEQYGELDDTDEDNIEVFSDKQFFFVVYKEIDSAVSALRSLNGSSLESFTCTKLIIKHAQIYSPPQIPPEPEWASVTDATDVPGLVLLQEFISEAQEQALLLTLCGRDAPWHTNLNRRVQ
eukprot:gene46235-61829_t